MSTDELRRQILELVERHAGEVQSAPAFRPGISAIPAAGKVIGGSEIRHMVDAALDGWLTSGRFNDKFERLIAQRILREARTHHQLGLLGQPAGTSGPHLAEPG
jgi:hypothetical protein